MAFTVLLVFLSLVWDASTLMVMMGRETSGEGIEQLMIQRTTADR